jgi:hypothetical protein
MTKFLHERTLYTCDVDRLITRSYSIATTGMDHAQANFRTRRHSSLETLYIDHVQWF